MILAFLLSSELAPTPLSLEIGLAGSNCYTERRKTKREVNKVVPLAVTDKEVRGGSHSNR